MAANTPSNSNNSQPPLQQPMMEEDPYLLQMAGQQPQPQGSQAQQPSGGQQAVVFPGIDPSDAIADSVAGSIDPEQAIYSPKTLYGFARQIMEGSSGAEAGDQQYQQEANNPLNQGAAMAGLLLPGPVGNAASSFLGGAANAEVAKGAIGGIAEAGLAPINLMNWATGEAFREIGSQLTGKSKEQLMQEDPEKYGDHHLEIPDWLKTDTLSGGLVNSIAQFYTGFLGIGALSKASKLGEAAQETSQLINTLRLAGKTFAVDTLFFDAQEGNLANLVSDLLGDKPGLAGQVARWVEPLAVTDKDNEIEGRLKNGLVGQFGEVLGGVVFGAASLLKSLRKVKGGVTGKALQNTINEIQLKSSQLDEMIQEIQQVDNNEILDMLAGMRKPTDVVEDTGETVLHGEVTTTTQSETLRKDTKAEFGVDLRKINGVLVFESTVTRADGSTHTTYQVGVSLYGSIAGHGDLNFSFNTLEEALDFQKVLQSRQVEYLSLSREERAAKRGQRGQGETALHGGVQEQAGHVTEDVPVENIQVKATVDEDGNLHIEGSAPAVEGGLPPLGGADTSGVVPLKRFSAKLYTEAGEDKALAILEEGHHTWGAVPLYLSNTPELSLGQGTNKGVHFEFTPQKMEGTLEKGKPGWEHSYGQGSAEFRFAYNPHEAYSLLDEVSQVSFDWDTMKQVFSGAVYKRAKNSWGRILEEKGFTRSAGTEGGRETFTRNTASTPATPEAGGKGLRGAEESAPNQGSPATGEPELEIIYPTDTIEEASEKIFKASASVSGERTATNEAAIEDLLREQATQGEKAFDKKAFAASLEAKIKAGGPIDIQEEILNHTDTRDLTNIDSYLENFKTILEATTKHVKRYESNADLVGRVKSILALDLGHEAWAGGVDDAFDSLVKRGIKSLTQDEEALLEMVALKMLSQHLIPAQMSRAALARFHGVTSGDTALVGRLDGELQALYQNQKTAESLFTQYASNAGRRLQAVQAPVTNSDGVEFMEGFAKAKQGMPLLGTGGKVLTKAELDAMANAAADIYGLGGAGTVGASGKAGKHFNAFLKALDTASTKTLKFGLGALQELFYNNILASFETFKAIGFNNIALKGAELASSATGAMYYRDTGALLRTKDEAEAFIRYMGEGILGGITVLGTGSKHKLDFTPAHPKVISQEGLRQYFGKSFGDLTAGTSLYRAGKLSDWVTDAIGTVINLPTRNFIGGIDAAFRVANQRSIIWAELKAQARFMGLDEIGARMHAALNVDSVTQDMILAREHGFKEDSFSPTGLLTTEQLKNLHGRLVDSTDTITLSHSLHGSAQSDRWLFKFLGNVDSAARMIPLVGTWELPFVKTFANTALWGFDANPLVNWMSPHNRAVFAGEMGPAAQQRLQGKTILGAAVGLAGIGAAASGLLSPVSGSHGAKKLENQLTGQGNYTVRFPIGGDKAVTLNFAKGSPLSDALFLPGHYWQISHAAIDGKIDPGAWAYASIALTGEAFSSSRFLRGATVSLDSFLNPSYSTADNFQRNVITGGLGTILMPGGRLSENITRFTDPYYRDYNNLETYIQSRLPGLSNEISPVYDTFGNPRPRDDYLGSTNTLAVNATRALTTVGIKYTTHDPLVKEVERFGILGQALTPPIKNMAPPSSLGPSYSGIIVPLDQYKNDKGESLWDAYNTIFRTLPRIATDGSGRSLTLRESINELVSSKEYQEDMKDNEVSRLTGKRQVILGSRWATLLYEYNSAKEEAKELLFTDPSYLRNYRNNSSGKTLEEVLENAMIKKMEVQE